MLFNSIDFAIFFVCVFSLYLLLGHKHQNQLLLAASCFFYATWNWKFLFLMLFSISVDYFCALRIHGTENNKIRKRFLLLSITLNLSILGFFKYFNFFLDNLHNLLSSLGLPVSTFHVFNIILPLGISFYTFEAISYVWDIYRREMVPTRNYGDYALFVIFFPHLIAGPIMRAKNLISQITSERHLTLENFYEGCHLIFLGLFQKIFVADQMAHIVNPVFSIASTSSGPTVLLAAYAFAFQIYCDFLGYSNIARGLGKCMGFDIMINFNLPYFSTTPREFWQRWHISLSTWLRDYVYIPLGGNRNGKFAEYKNLLVTMFLGGLWHGASWTFILWGMYHGFLLIVYRLSQPFTFKKWPPLHNPVVSKVWSAIKVIFFFHLICFGWLLFRAASLTDFCVMIKALLFNFELDSENFETIRKFIFYAFPFVSVELLQYLKSDLMIILKLNPLLKALLYAAFFYLMLFNGESGGKAFIYFQF